MIKKIIRAFQAIRYNEAYLRSHKSQEKSKWKNYILIFALLLVPPIFFHLFKLIYTIGKFIIGLILNDNNKFLKFLPTDAREFFGRPPKQGSCGALEPVLINVKIKEIYFNYIEYKNIKELVKNFNCRNVVNYKWDKLLNSIKKHGLAKPIQIGDITSKKALLENIQDDAKKAHITNHKIYNYKECKYMIFDGNHRLMVLKELYGEDATITVAYKPHARRHSIMYETKDPIILNVAPPDDEK